MQSESVAAAVAEVRREIAAHASRHGVTLCAVTKGFGVDAIRLARDAGCEAIGENYAQELQSKMTELGDEPRPEVHFIGRIQSNKIRLVAPWVAVWQTVDRGDIIAEIARRAPAGTRIMIQVNAALESGKGGCRPEDVPALLAAAADNGIVVDGLMTMGPTSQDPDDTRRTFRAVRRLADGHGLVGCSMGMSGDLRIALEEGSTLVRVGTRLFGERPVRPSPTGVL